MAAKETQLSRLVDNGMKKIAYLDCFSGISGDMFLGALVDVGVSPHLLGETVAALNAAADLKVSLEISRVERSGISATKVDVLVGGEKDRPRTMLSHAPEHHQHGHEHPHAQDTFKKAATETPWARGHTEEPHFVGNLQPDRREHEQQAHSHGHEQGEHHHHRGLAEIREIIARTTISDTARQRAVAIFEALGAAEAKIHNVDIERVHFHEVGAADAIVDIVCAAVGSEALHVDEWLCSPLNVGSGSVECAHGSFPVPAPATLELLQGAPIFSSGIQAELVTPTGAAIVKTLTSRYQPMPRMKVAGSGYGAGSRDFKAHANVLRILVGEAQEAIADDMPLKTVSVLEATLDDMNPQVFGYVMERALTEGALEVFATPVHMKKNRPGMLVTVLCRPAEEQKFAKLIFAETTTLGVRIREEKRRALPRKQVVVKTPWGEVRLKVAAMNGAIASYAPEYEDCRRIAASHGVPLKQVMQEAVQLYLQTASHNQKPSG